MKQFLGFSMVKITELHSSVLLTFPALSKDAGRAQRALKTRPRKRRRGCGIVEGCL